MRIYLLSGMCLLITSQLVAQSPDSAGVGIIHVETGEQSFVSQAIVPYEQDFFRHKILLRLSFQESANQGLNRVYAPRKGNTMEQSLVRHLLDAMRRGQLRGRHPTNLQRSYDFMDLVFDLMRLEQRSLSNIDSISAEELGLEWLEGGLDLIVDEGISRQDSRPFRRIQYLRLIWYDPQRARGAHVMVLLPYAPIRRLAGTWQLQPRPGSGARVSLLDFLEAPLFQAQRFSIHLDPSWVLAPQSRPDNLPPLIWREP